jgi:hypothetical protein
MHALPEWNQATLLQSPLLEPLHALITQLSADHFPSLSNYNKLLATHHPMLATHGGQTANFVAQAQGKLPFDEQYEPRCYLRGEIQTRSNNWHDFFNTLVWLTFPKSKALINARHYHALTTCKTSIRANTTDRSQRGALRDANTLLDESGVIVVYTDETLATLLRDFSWKELFWQQREQVQHSMGFYLFGHGLYEKSLNPYIGMTGQGILLKVEANFFKQTLTQQLEHLDIRLADHLIHAENHGDTTQFSPVPLLGIPGWSSKNKIENYYENTAYFRPKRIKT